MYISIKNIIDMRKLKDLTPEECIEIAKIINHNVNWKFYISKNAWDGFDLVNADSETAPYNNIIQIAHYGDSINTIFRELDNNIREVNITNIIKDRVIPHLQSINVEF